MDGRDYVFALKSKIRNKLGLKFKMIIYWILRFYWPMMGKSEQVA
jgi:hypothetical protein